MQFFSKISDLIHKVFFSDELSENRKNIIVEQLFASTSNSFVGGNFFTGLLVWLNISDVMIGNISMIIALGNVFQFFSPFFMGRYKRIKKPVIFWKSITYIINIIAIGIIPFLGSKPAISGLIIIPLVFLVTFINAVITPAMSSWHLKSIPADISKDYFSFFTLAINILTLVATFFAGKFVDFYNAKGMEIYGLTILRLAAVIISILDLIWLHRIREYPEANAGEKQHFNFRTFIVAFSDKNYRINIIAAALWTFSSSLIGPYYNLYLLKDLHVEYSTMALVNMAMVVVMIIFIPVWTRLIKKTSYFKTLLLLMHLFLLHFIILSTVTSKTLFLYPIGAVYSYIFFAGISVITVSLPYYNIPELGQMNYISCYSAVCGVAALLGTEAGTIFISVSSGFSISPFGIPFHNIQMLAVISAAVMFICSLLLRKLVNKNSNNDIEPFLKNRECKVPNA